MRGALAAALCCLALGGCRCETSSSLKEQPLRAMPATVDFSIVYVGATKTRTVDVSNPNLFGVPVTPTAPPQFSADAFELGAGSDTMATITFAPTVHGFFSGVVMFGDAGVTVTGVGRIPPPCVPSDGCHSSAFSLDAGACLETPLPDGTDCTASLPCFVQAHCESAVCIGTLTACDDGNPCTTDVCGTSGCGHVDGLLSCPGSTNPCLAPACDPDAGCGFVPVHDGMLCGAHDCHTAEVCINAACVSRAVPQTLGCADVVAGVPEGYGHADGFGATARFESGPLWLAVDGAGNVWMIDGANRELRRVTPAGEVTTVAGQLPSLPFYVPPTDGFGQNAFLPNPGPLAIAATGEIVFWDSYLWRRATPAGLVASWLGTAGLPTHVIADGIGMGARVGAPCGIARGAGGELFTLERDEMTSDLVLRQISSLGQITSLTRIAVVPDPNETFDLAWSQGDLFVSRQSEGVLKHSGSTTTPFWSGTGALGLAASGTGELAVNFMTELVVLGPDAGTLTTWLPPGGELIADVTSSFPGRWVVALTGQSVYGTRLVIVDDGGTTLLAGPDWPHAVVDGPTAAAGFSGPLGVRAGLAGDIFVFDERGIRRIFDGTVSTWWQLDAGFGGHLAMSNATVIGALQDDVIAVTGPDAGGVIVPHLHCEGIDARGSTLVGSCFGGIRGWNLGADGGADDAGFIPWNAESDIAFDDTGGVYVQDGFSMADLHFDGGMGASLMLGGIFPTPRPFARSPGGDVFVAGGNDYSILRLTTSGTLSVVATLADPPQAIAVEDGGTLLVTVPDAVLRIRP